MSKYAITSSNKKTQRASSRTHVCKLTSITMLLYRLHDYNHQRPGLYTIDRMSHPFGYTQVKLKRSKYIHFIVFDYIELQHTHNQHAYLR